ncbi:MAG TPA: MFS transporter, partial [Candidatus Deferrimicrobium sp.]|nr:MFS transporter [Candidatus Deferrimicrobium sp.]
MMATWRSTAAVRAWIRMDSEWAAFAGIFIVTNLGLLAVGATLAVLPHYVKDNLDGSDLEVGIVTGAFAFTGIVCRPIAGNLADRRGRKPTVIGGALLAATAGFLYFVPAGIPGLIVARFFLGAGEGTVFTAGSAWNVDMAPEERRGRMIGLYGLAIWTGLTLGPPIGVLLQHAGGFHLVWAFAAGAPLLGAAIASQLPEQYRATEDVDRGPFISREALGPGVTFALSVVGFAAVSAFIVLSLDERGIGHGPEVFSVFAATVVATRLVAGGLPDRIGAARCAVGAALIETIGLILLGAADGLAVVIVGAIGMGAAFSLLFPSLSLVAINRVRPERRGVAMGTFTANFDLGMLVGSPLVGAAAAVGGYSAAFY